MTTSSERPGPDPKVLRLIRKYGLEDVGDELEARWTHPENRTSLRELADSFNERLLRAVLVDADVETLTDDVSRLYALLSGTDGSRGEQTVATRRLERAGVDVETLTDEFVSYGAIRSYLTGYRDASLRDTDRDARETVRGTIEGLRQRTVAVTESKLARLRDTDHLQLGTHRVHADVQVLCEECGRQYDVATLLERGACDCGNR
ncbi:rod-determining factor RdfA [Natrinema gelatinilyticum]|uniref:rod-determining factor RdfA n=1 Tax=Natrinema gelatinilyticum TaxID=2961571 RepID=UPI0020C3A1EE|nr:rod-determining factor RdfA [Natrinema gelatinilyticum]